MLNYAADEAKVIQEAPTVRFLKLPPQRFDFFDFAEWDRLVEAARQDPEWYPAILVAGDAGLRMGEILALEWSDINSQAGSLTVRHSDWQGKIGSPKGGRERTVPMTETLHAALKAHRHLRGRWVFMTLDGKRMTRNRLKHPLWDACKRAGLRKVGWHVLRHSYCSHLAMGGAAPKAIQELAGHVSIATTMRYMHATPGALRETVKILDVRRQQVRGNGHGTATKNGRPDGESSNRP